MESVDPLVTHFDRVMALEACYKHGDCMALGREGTEEKDGCSMPHMSVAQETMLPF